jgi:antitoxin component of MazEF toxin-antitoxin module
MGRKIFSSGNSTVISIPPSVLEALDLRVGDQIDIVADPEHQCIIITPTKMTASMPSERPKVQEKLEQFIARYEPILERLTEGESPTYLREKPQINANALKKAQRLRPEFAAHAGVLTHDLVAASRAERSSHVSELLDFSEEKGCDKPSC